MFKLVLLDKVCEDESNWKMTRITTLLTFAIIYTRQEFKYTFSCRKQLTNFTVYKQNYFIYTWKKLEVIICFNFKVTFVSLNFELCICSVDWIKLINRLKNKIEKITDWKQDDKIAQMKKNLFVKLDFETFEWIAASFFFRHILHEN